MEPIRIYLENFMSHRLTDIDCTLFKTALIIGRNKYNEAESNGVGKTTIFKAIIFALFGEYNFSTINKIVKDGENICKVIFDFSTSAGIFRVVRSRSKKSNKSDLRLFEKRADEWHDITQKTATEVEVELAKIIKITYKAFQNSVLFAQSDLNGLASATPEARRGILKEALNLAVYSKLEKLAKEDLVSTIEKNNFCKAKINLLGNPSEELPKLEFKLDEIKNLIIKLELDKNNIQESLTKTKSELTELQSFIATNSNDLFQQKLNEIQSSKKTTQNNLNNSKKILLEKETLVKNLTAQLNTKSQQVIDLNSSIDDLKNKNSNNIEDIILTLNSLIENEANGKALISRLKLQQIELETPFPDGDVCPHCRQHLSPEHKNTCLQKVAEDLIIVKNQILSNSKKLELLKIKKISVESEIKNINLTDAQLIKSNNQVINIQNDLNNNKILLTQSQEMIERLKTEVINYSMSLDEILKQEIELQSNINKLDLNSLKIKNDKLQNELSKFSSELQTCLKNITFNITQQAIITEKFNNKTKDLVDLDICSAELKLIEKDQQLKQMVVQGFGSGGIPTMIIYTILDDLQIEANKLLTQIRPGLELQFSIVKSKQDGQQEDTLDIAYRINGQDREYEQLSGGQRIMIALSLKAGLSLVIQHRLGVDIKFLILDEVDQSLDKSGTDSFADIIKQWQDKFKIFVITHNEHLKQHFKNVIIVESDGAGNSYGNLMQ